MTESNQQGQKAIRPINVLSIISLGTGILGWVVAIFIMLTSFTPLSSYVQLGGFASFLLLTVPGFSWLTAISTGRNGIKQIKAKGAPEGTGYAKWGIAISGIGCVLLYGFFLLVAIGFYFLIKAGYIGFMLYSSAIPF
jgi:hypothetical protein